MKDMESFLVCYYIMDKCFWECHEKLEKEQETRLATLMSSLNPGFWGTGRAAVSAEYEEWKEQTDTASLHSENIRDAVMGFLEHEERLYHADFTEVKKVLRRIATPQMVEDALDYARDMYEEYDYDD